jgi:hypothetical protein
VQVLLVTTVSAVDMGAFRSDAGQRRRLFQHITQRVAVKRVAVQRIGMEDEHPAFGATVGRGNGGLAAELVRRTRLALAPSRRSFASSAGQRMHSTSGACQE